jgi:hypothetical protein
MALRGVIHKPFCWFRYVVDTFVNWPHGLGKLIEISDHLNTFHENKHFTMVMEWDVQPPFLDTDMYQKLMANGDKKSTINPHTLTSVSMSTATTTLPANKLYFPCWCTGPDPFVSRKAHIMCWTFSRPLSGKMAMMTSRSNRLSQSTIECHCSTEKHVSVTFLPFVTLPPPSQKKIPSFLQPVKDNLEVKTPGMHNVPCKCVQVYTGHWPLHWDQGLKHQNNIHLEHKTDEMWPKTALAWHHHALHQIQIHRQNDQDVSEIGLYLNNTDEGW